MNGGVGVTRQFAFDYSAWSVGRAIRTGPDGMETVVQFDAAHRATSVTRGLPGQTPVMTANYTYLANGLVSRVDYGNLTSTLYSYDAAQRLTMIHHKNAVNGTILRLDYTYTANNLIAGITERDITNTVVASTTFGYDVRDQLISEVRAGESPYDFAYRYDRGGNRVKKIETVDASVRIETTYTYDVENAPLYGSANNRLMTYVEEQVTADPTAFGGETRTLRATTFYFYNNEGNVTRVVTEKANPAPGEPRFSATRMAYARNGRAVTFVMGETWNDNARPPADYTITYAREFRYDSPRQRYLNRELDPVALQNTGALVSLSSTWSDYDGNYGHGDFAVNSTTGTVSNVRSYEVIIGVVDPWTSSGETATNYAYEDLIGTVRGVTNASGSSTGEAVYTAFGERRGGGAIDRFGYAGKWGYQTAESGEFPFLQLGARYYDPGSGRFLQRDTSGILGGLNVYAYVLNLPTLGVDPVGEGFWDGDNWFHEWVGGKFSTWWPNKGRIRYGPSRVRVGYRRWGTRLAFRYGSTHIYGVRGALIFGGSITGAAGVGIVGGRVVDETFGTFNNDYRISDGLADILFRWWNDDPNYNPWGRALACGPK